MEHTREKGCCVNCRESLADNFCNVHDCKCHTPQPVEWENAFIARFGYLEQKGRIVTGEVLLFIRTQIAAAEERGYQQGASEKRDYQRGTDVAVLTALSITPTTEK